MTVSTPDTDFDIIKPYNYTFCVYTECSFSHNFNGNIFFTMLNHVQIKIYLCDHVYFWGNVQIFEWTIIIFSTSDWEFNFEISLQSLVNGDVMNYLIIIFIVADSSNLKKFIVRFIKSNVKIWKQYSLYRYGCELFHWSCLYPKVIKTTFVCLKAFNFLFYFFWYLYEKNSILISRVHTWKTKVSFLRLLKSFEINRYLQF